MLAVKPLSRHSRRWSLVDKWRKIAPFDVTNRSQCLTRPRGWIDWGPAPVFSDRERADIMRRTEDLIKQYAEERGRGRDNRRDGSGRRPHAQLPSSSGGGNRTRSGFFTTVLKSGLSVGTWFLARRYVGGNPYDRASRLAVPQRDWCQGVVPLGKRKVQRRPRMVRVFRGRKGCPVRECE